MPMKGSRHIDLVPKVESYDVEIVLDEVAKYLVKQYGAPYGMTHPVDRQRVKDALAAREAK